MMTLEEAIAHAKEISENQYICEECQKEHRQLADWLEELKSLREKSKWIPCSERLPENDIKEVLVWFEFRYGAYNRPYQTIGISYTYKGKWRGLINGESEWKDLKVIAWMPLQEPYKEDEDAIH